MTYLLDANVLIALGYTRHQSHRQVGAWVSELRATGGANFATCAITELAFVRVGAQAGYYVDVAMAKKALHVLKTRPNIVLRGVAVMLLFSLASIISIPACVRVTMM